MNKLKAIWSILKGKSTIYNTPYRVIQQVGETSGVLFCNGKKLRVDFIKNSGLVLEEK